MGTLEKCLPTHLYAEDALFVFLQNTSRSQKDFRTLWHPEHRQQQCPLQDMSTDFSLPSTAPARCSVSLRTCSESAECGLWLDMKGGRRLQYILILLLSLMCPWWLSSFILVSFLVLAVEKHAHESIGEKRSSIKLQHFSFHVFLFHYSYFSSWDSGKQLCYIVKKTPQDENKR